MADELNQNLASKPLLFEIAWEVCNQVGGIYTVIRSKIPAAVKHCGHENYFVIGPFVHKQVYAMFEPIDDFSDPIGQTVLAMRQSGYEVHYGHWLVSGSPKTILFNPFTIYNRLGSIKYELWDHHGISTANTDDLMSQVIAFGHQVQTFFKVLTGFGINRPIIAHFHEWMAGTAIPEIRRDQLPMKIVFTTHATLLGRYLAMNDPVFYDHLPFYNWEAEAEKFAILTSVKIERAAAHGAHVFTTVSDVTAMECRHLLGRNPEVLLPNGLNIERFEALHEFQILHRKYKERIHEFVMGHFFPSYSFNLDKTIYFFTSGRFEYKNKGFDVTLEALARLNWRLKQAGSDMTVVTFFVTKQDTHSVNTDVLNSRVMLDEIRRNCEDIEQQIGKRLFYSITANTKMPDLNSLVDDRLKLSLRRTVQAWKSDFQPPVVTHYLTNEGKDEIMGFIRRSGLWNLPDDKVKIVYHPDFIQHSNPLFKIEYPLFVRGCHLGIFPSYYEPWGYTPLECLASGLPAITSDLAGFGDYVVNHIPNHEEQGIFVIHRKFHNEWDAAEELADKMFRFVNMTRRERITLRNQSEGASVHFDWKELYSYYKSAYAMAEKM